MAKRSYRKIDNQTRALSYEEGRRLPTNQRIAVYYRQSSMAQVGNISTTLQQVDLPCYIQELGWSEDQIILIDEDAGVSGTTRIDEREGMSRLYDLITEHKIGAVACQAEDRLFRDETLIQPNIFIAACQEANVRVITPYMRYNFNDPYEGQSHRFLFRARAEQAADFISTYVRGKLHAARRWLSSQGLWAGNSIAIGYIVDDRKNLPDGSFNPNWRKFVPFEPYVTAVNRYFDLFLSKGGNIGATARYIVQNRLVYPDFDDPQILSLVPEGFVFLKPYNFKKRSIGYYPAEGALISMFTNAVYLGHWIANGHIVRWHNHPAIVPEDVFMKAFNYLSPVSLDGTPNLHYNPRVRNERPSLEERRGVPYPLYAGLVGTEYEGKWYNGSVVWSTQAKVYAYSVSAGFPEEHLLWHKRAEYLDTAVTKLLHTKLRVTFDSEVWNSTLATYDDHWEEERKRTHKQLAAVEQKQRTLISNMALVTIPKLVADMQVEYEQYETEKLRLQAKLDEAAREIRRREELAALQKQSEIVLSDWKKMTVDERRMVAHAFIDKIVVTPLPLRAIHVIVHWRDNTTDDVALPRQGTTYTTWLKEETDKLAELVERGAPQLEIAATFPNRTWELIRNKIYAITGEFSYKVFPKPIKDKESYEAFFRRTQGGSDAAKIENVTRWQPDEIARLEQMLDAGTTQIELATAFPRRNWDGIRRKITSLRGSKFRVKDTGHVWRWETIDMYRNRLARESGTPARTRSHASDDGDDDGGGDDALGNSGSTLLSGKTLKTPTRESPLPSEGEDAFIDTTFSGFSNRVRLCGLTSARRGAELCRRQPTRPD